MPSFYQSSPSGYNEQTSTSVSATTSFNFSTFNGSLLLAVCAAITHGTIAITPASFAPPTVLGFTWILAGTISNSSAYFEARLGNYMVETIAIFYIVNAPSMSNSAVVTATATTATSEDTEVAIELFEYTGVATNSAFDAVVTAKGLKGMPSAGSITGRGTDVIFVAVTDDWGDMTIPGSGFGLVGFGGIEVHETEDIESAAPGVYQAAWGSTSSTNWAAIAVAFSSTPLIPPLPACVPSVGGVMTNGTYITDLGLYIGPATALYTNPILAGRIAASETTLEGRKSIVIDFDSGAGLYARDFETVFTWPIGMGTVLDVWQPSLLEQPESVFGRAGDWDNAGNPGAKYIQGIVVEANSFNIPKTFQLQSADDLSFHTLNECPATFNLQSEKAFSCAPFVAHSARWISSDGVAWEVFGTRLVFQPFPEMTLNWQTELSSLGLIGWGHVREINLPHISTANLTLVLTFDFWPTITINVPNSGGLQVKTKITIPPNKFKLIGFRVYSTAGFRVFASDLEVKVKQWGSTGPYDILKPFGGQGSSGAAV